MLHVRTAWPGDEAIHAHRGDCANRGCSGVAAFDRRVILHCCADVDRRSLPSPAMYLVIRRALRVVFSRLDEEPVAPTRTCHKLLTRSAHAFIQNTRCSCPANVATIHQASAFPNVRRVCLFAAACLRLFSARRFCHRCGLCCSVLRDPRSVVIVSSGAMPLCVSAAVPILPLLNQAPPRTSTRLCPIVQLTIKRSKRAERAPGSFTDHLSGKPACTLILMRLYCITPSTIAMR